MQFGLQQQQMAHPSLMNMRQLSTNSISGLTYNGFNNYAAGMQGMGPRSSSYGPGSYGMRVGTAYRTPGTPKGRARGGPDTSSSTTDSGIGLRSALLEEFRAN